MDIKFKSIHIENFMSIGEIDLDFVDKGFTLIEGVNNNINDNARSNGSGKSSIFEALVWALTGNTVRGNKDVVNYNREGGTLVTIKMIVDNNTFNVTRTKEHSKYKTNLFIEINGVDKSGKGIRDSEKLLSEYLPDLTPSLIGSVIVLGQGLPQKFSNNSPSGRKEVLEKLFKSDYMIEDLKQRVSKRRIELSEHIRGCQDLQLIDNTKIETLSTNIQKDTEKLNKLKETPEMDTTIKELEVLVSTIEKQAEELRIECDTYEEKRLTKSSELSELKVKVSETLLHINEEYVTVLQDIQNNINESTVSLNLCKSELNRVKNIKDVCPTCGQKLPDVHKPDITKYEEDLKTAQSQYDKWVSKLGLVNDEIDTKKRVSTEKINYEINLCKQEISEILSKIQQIMTDRNNLSKKLVDTQKQLLECTSLKNNLNLEIRSLEQSILDNTYNINELKQHVEEIKKQEELYDERLEIQNKFNTALTRNFRGYLLNDIICYINEKSKEYCKLVFDTDLIDFCLDGNNLSIYYDNKEYEALSGGERQKVDLIIQFAIRDMLCRHTSFSSNIIVLDEIFDNLDDIGCQKILDLITTRLYDIDSVFIITHHGNELNIPYDTVIKIQKDNDGVTKVI